MPSLMDLKKELPRRQLGSFRESFYSVECFYKVSKQKNRGELKTSQKEKWKWERRALWKWELALNFVHAHGNFVNLDYKNFSTKIIIPLYKSIIIKKMCKDLPLGLLDCLLVCAV